MTLELLKKHIDCAEEILADTAPLSTVEEASWNLDLKGVDILCKEGVSVAFFEKVNLWLKGKEGRRLFFIEDNVSRLKAFALQPQAPAILNHPCVKIFFLESPIQKNSVAKKIGSLAAFKELLIVGKTWEKLIQSYHIAAQQIASDAADFGVAVMQHLKINFKKPLHSLASLKGSMKGIPAVICGAGPSLEKNGHFLKEWKGKALLFAAGNSIHLMDAIPDVAIAFDSHIPVIRNRYFDVPVCVQSRTHPECLRAVTGEALYFPESHYAFESWLVGTEPYINSGWTAGTAGVAIAAYLGCTEILLIGMDYCYRGEQKYAKQKVKANISPLLRAQDREGKEVWTQRDWLLAIEWLEAFATSHPEISFMNISEGMSIQGFGPEKLNLVEQADLKWKQAVTLASPISLNSDRLGELYASLKRCHRQELTPINDSEIALELLLEPLWRVWSPLFERELMADPNPISLEEKMAIQKFLFFNQVIEEHLHERNK